MTLKIAVRVTASDLLSMLGGLGDAESTKSFNSFRLPIILFYINNWFLAKKAFVILGLRNLLSGCWDDAWCLIGARFRRVDINIRTHDKLFRNRKPITKTSYVLNGGPLVGIVSQYLLFEAIQPVASQISVLLHSKSDTAKNSHNGSR